MNDIIGLLKEASKVIKAQEETIAGLSAQKTSKEVAQNLADNNIINKEAVEEVSKVDPEILEKLKEETIEKTKVASLGEPDKITGEGLNAFEKGLVDLAEQHGWT